MRTPARCLGFGAALMSLVITTLVIGCARQEARPSNANAAEVDRDVTDLLNRWNGAFDARDLEGVRSVLADHDRFVWLEDGEPRYRSVDEIVRALESLPSELVFTNTLRDIRIVPISEDAAWAQLATSTKIERTGQVVSEFTAVVLMIARRDAGGWRIHAAHSSTSRPRSNAPG